MVFHANTLSLSTSVTVYLYLGHTKGRRGSHLIRIPYPYNVICSREMHAKNRLPSSGHNTPSPPASPLRSPRLRHPRSGKTAARFGLGVNRSITQRVAWIVLTFLLRRQGVFLFAPLLYISGMLFYMGTVSFDVVPDVIKSRRAPGSVYRSPELYAKLRHEMDADNSSSDAVSSFQSLP